MKHGMPGQAELRELFDYDENSGLLTWRRMPLAAFRRVHAGLAWNTRFAGTQAGHVFTDRHGKSYRKVTVRGCSFRYHRLVVKWMTGEEPLEVDHADGDGLNNAWSNITICRDSYSNHKNKRLSTVNKSGLSGVHWDLERGKFTAQIYVDGHKRLLGRFCDFFEACCSRKSAEKAYGYSPMHGRVRPL